jgi:hypothetical protein
MVFTDFSGRATESHLQRLVCFTLEFGVPIDYPETSVNNHLLTPCNIPEGPRPHTFKYLRFLYDRMTVHRNRCLMNKTNRCTEIQFYWYHEFTCFGQPFCPSSGVLSRISALVHFMQLWWPYATRSRMELDVQNSWWWVERLPETCRVVIPIKLDFSESVGFIHKEFHVSFFTGKANLSNFRGRSYWR